MHLSKKRTPNTLDKGKYLMILEQTCGMNLFSGNNTYDYNNPLLKHYLYKSHLRTDTKIMLVSFCQQWKLI